MEENELIALTAAVEQSSEHPLGASIVAAARERGLKLPAAQDFHSTTGGGVGATVNGQAVLAGKRVFLREHSVMESDAPGASAEALQKRGQTVIFVARDGREVGFLAVADPVKPGASEAVAGLRGQGLRVVMLTGDSRATAEAVAARIGGIDEVRAEVLPEQKQAAIAELRGAGRVVAMAGDGINDAPALAAADVGVAMGTGTDVAMESAGVTLIGGDLTGLVRARRLSRAVMRNIRENLFFSLVFNSAGIPVAAGALYPVFGLLLSPVFAGAAMAFSSVAVIGNALRLRAVKL